MIFGCDVSGYQPSTLVPWEDARIGFAIVKMSEANREATSARLHIPKVRAAGKRLGGYHFFHPEFDPQLQYDEFYSVSVETGYGTPDDIVPAIDIEYFSGHGVTPAWCKPLRAFADLIEQAFAKPLLYCSESTWVCLGRPAWLVDYPLWVPAYMADGWKPKDTLAPGLVPVGAEWAIWQYYVGPLFGTTQDSRARGAVDQNRANYLPLISGERVLP